jgi:hypothetical protein
MAGPYSVGATITLEVNLTDPDTGGPVDAPDITCRVKTPGGTVSPVTPVTQFSAGVYRGRYLIAAEGEHWFEFASATLGMQKEGAFVADTNRVV